MNRLSAVLRGAEGNRFSFWCPGCDKPHSVRVGDGGWAFDFNHEKPTFTPSVKITNGHYVQDYDGGGCWCTHYQKYPPEPGDITFKCAVCHFYITHGRIEFQNDSTHALSGQTVDMVEFEE